ncbi:MAG: ketoacyl-ACP synthase III [Lachnospiraceae bacterium]|nr:ketoacyl-ACP synthase III [Lachnospiraceae bacterium]
MITRITGTGSCLPEQIVTNEDLSKVVDTSDEWISSRTGIRERHLAKDETTASMAAEAGRRALQDAGIGAEEVDLLIVGTITGDYVTPSTSCEVQEILGAVNAVAFDINAACAGFMFALHTAHAYLQSGIYKTALVLGAETLSKIMDWKDRSTCVLFGDGAGAAVVRAFEKGKAEDKAAGGILAFEQGSDGRKGKVLSCLGRRNNNPLIENPFIPSYVSMNGQEVYKFAVNTVPASIQKVLELAGLETGDIKYFVLHQANIRILQAVAKRLKADMEKFPVSLDHCGNISAASVPILLDEMNRKGMLEKGDKIVMSGFGGGLTWASAVLEW